MTKQKKLRHLEYYDLQECFDDLYAKSKQGEVFTKLMDLISGEENIRLAYRNIKRNTGSHTSGTDNLNIEDIERLSAEKLTEIIQRKFRYYKPNSVKRVEIPKPNGKTRPLGIPTIVERLIQQCILQVLEPICEAKFHERSNGFRPNRSAEHALAQCYRMIQMQNLHFVVDIDIKGFFDNVNHSKLIRQMWAMGIRDKQLICIIKEMLRAPIVMPDGKTIYPTKGTPQGGILSPLLANIVLNELDWWMDFSDCRYAVEKSARKLIKEGVLLEDNLKVIEQAFNDVEVSSNPIRHGLTDSTEIIKAKHTLVVPIEEETQSTEFVEITEIETTETTVGTVIDDFHFKSVSLGFNHSCFIDNNCNLYTCGSNYNGQLGNGDTEDSLYPIKIMNDISYISSNSCYNYAITKSGALYAWGDNLGGSLGSDNVEDRNILVPTKILENVSSIYDESFSFCAAITNSSELYMWGSNYDNVIPNCSEGNVLIPIKVMDNVKSVDFNERNGACITTDGSLYIWGNNFYGQIGNGKFGGMGTLGKDINDNPITILSPYKVMDDVAQVSLGNDCCAVVTNNGMLYMWGDN